MHDFSHMAALPGVLMFPFFAFALFMPIMAFVFFAMFRWGRSSDGAMILPWMDPAKAFHAVGWGHGDQSAARETGNAAFDTYRAEMIARLEEEAEAFAAFRDRLRAAKDHEQFEQFLDEMKSASRD